jgi:hypothetical protein
MNKFGLATVTAAAFATALLGFAGPAAAAPSGPSNAQDTISQLEDRGVRVIVNHEGVVGPLDQATVTSVRLDTDDHVAYVNVR